MLVAWIPGRERGWRLCVSCLPSGEDAEFLDSGLEFFGAEGFHAAGRKGFAGEGG